MRGNPGIPLPTLLIWYRQFRLSRLDNDDLTLSTQRYLHEWLGEGRLYSQHEGDHSGPSRGSENGHGFHGLFLPFTKGGLPRHGGCFSRS